MGAPAAVATLLPLVQWLQPRCIAMCGVCAGRPDKGVLLGDVIAADQVFYHDTGKQLPVQARPLTTEWREQRALLVLRDRVPEPWDVVDPAM
jgi:nucleoside phosphorylase